QERERAQRLEADAEPDAVTDRVDVASLGRSGAGALRDFSRELPLREVDAAVALPHVARRDSRSEASADGELRAPVEQSREADPGTRLIAGIEFAELAGQREAEPAEVVPQPHTESLDDADGADPVPDDGGITAEERPARRELDAQARAVRGGERHRPRV